MQIDLLVKVIKKVLLKNEVDDMECISVLYIFVVFLILRVYDKRLNYRENYKTESTTALLFACNC